MRMAFTVASKVGSAAVIRGKQKKGSISVCPFRQGPRLVIFNL
jgi:hypothetical protein